jgi:hypothetical protein
MLASLDSPSVAYFLDTEGSEEYKRKKESGIIVKKMS